MRAAVFLDRDGVIVENRPDHVKNWSEVEFLDGAIPALRRLAESRRAIVIVSNQGAVGRGIMTLDAAWDLQRQIVRYIEEHGGRIDASYLCPHHPNGGCACRKPRPGMLLQAAGDLKLNLAQSWLIGDAVTDIQCAEAAGVHGILVRTGRGAQQELLIDSTKKPIPPVVDDLAIAARHILGGHPIINA
jgi:D-glycero-D-manno-heptose 1,7-bisphosphate phosphatase